MAYLLFEKYYTSDTDSTISIQPTLCAGYLGHLFTKSESYAGTIALISHLAS